MKQIVLCAFLCLAAAIKANAQHYTNQVDEKKIYSDDLSGCSAFFGVYSEYATDNADGSYHNSLAFAEASGLIRGQFGLDGDSDSVYNKARRGWLAIIRSVGYDHEVFQKKWISCIEVYDKISVTIDAIKSEIRGKTALPFADEVHPFHQSD